MKRSLMLFAAAGLLVLGQPAKAVETLKILSYLPPASVTVKEILTPFIQQVEAATKGEIKFQTYWGGSLGRDPEKQYKLLVDGIGDIVWMSNYLQGGQFPDSTIFDLPNIIQTSTVGSVAYWRMLKQGMLTGFDDIRVVSVYMTGLNGIHTRKAFKTLHDLKGMKIRASGPVAAEFLKQFGVVPVYMSNNALPEALSRGVVDGLTNEWTGLTTFKIHNVVNYHYEGYVGATSFVVGMNKKVWERLSPAAKAAIDKFSGETMALAAGKAYDAAEISRRKPHLNDKNRVFIFPTDAEIQAVEKFAQPVYDNWIKNTPNGARKFAALKAILADIRAVK